MNEVRIVATSPVAGGARTAQLGDIVLVTRTGRPVAPAIVTRVFEGECVNLTVFHDCNVAGWRERVERVPAGSDHPGWHYPDERAPEPPQEAQAPAVTI